MRERLLDAIAAKIGVDKIEIRRRNLIGKSAMPYALGLDTLGTHIVYDSGDYALLLDKALAAGRLARAASATCTNAARNGEKVGAGVAMFVEKSGLGPFDTVRIEVKPIGAIEVVTGVASLGQGVETAMAQICADALGVDYATIQRHPRPDRPHRQRHGRLCLARHGDVRRSDAAGRGEAAREGARSAAAELMQTARR